MSADTIVTAEPTETASRTLSTGSKDGAIVVAPETTASLSSIEGGVLHIFAELDITAADLAWIRRYAELAGGDCCEPYVPGVDHFAVTIAPGSPLAVSP